MNIIGGYAKTPSSPRELSAHRAEFLWLDLVQHAHFAGLAMRILCLAEIFLRQAVDVIVSTLLRDLDYLAANFKITIRIVGNLDRHGDAWVAAYVFIFHTTQRRVDSNVRSVVVEPDRRNLWTAILHQGAEIGEGFLIEKISVLLNVLFCHGTSRSHCFVAGIKTRLY